MDSDRVLPVDFLEGQDMTGGLGSLNNAEALIEYKLAHAIQKITATTAPAIGYLLDNGEPQTYNVYDFVEHMLSRIIALILFILIVSLLFQMFMMP